MGNTATARPSQAMLDRRTMPRYSFTATTELTDFSSATHLAGRVTELSRNGCYVDVRDIPPVGTELSVRIARERGHFVAPAKTIYVHESKGMGVVFLNPADDQMQVLEAWLSEIPADAQI